MKNKYITISLIILCVIVFVLGFHGGSEYYFCDFCVHKTLNMFYNQGSPLFFKKPNFVSDIQAVFYWFFYLFLKSTNVVDSFDNFVRLLTNNNISTSIGNISFKLPGLIVSNIFSAIGVCFTFLTTYILTNKKIVPSFISGFILATTYIWMNFTHHLAVDIPLSALCITTIFFTIYFVRNKECYSLRNIIILGILSGLCVSTKYNGFLVALAPIIVLFYTKKSIKYFIKNSLILTIVIFYTFFITNPYTIIHFYDFIHDFSFEYNHAFYNGHNGYDDMRPFLFHIFHSLPNAIGIYSFICSILGFIIFCKDKKISSKYKYAFLTFPIAFLIFMSFSWLVFLRYVLPIIPFLTIFIGILVNYITEQNTNKIVYKIGVFAVVVLLIQNSINAVHFYNVMSTKDTRIITKNIYKSLNIDNTKISTIHSNIFSNAYYEEDFLNSYPNIKDDIRSYLKNSCNDSLKIFQKSTSQLFNNYDIIIMDSGTYDRFLQIRKYEEFSGLNFQYFMYSPHRISKYKIKQAIQPLYVLQINPYKRSKEQLSFDALRSDFKYRYARGPFLEIYFKDKDLRDRFAESCKLNSVKCESVKFDKSYYYKYFEKLYDKIDRKIENAI